MLTGAQAIYSKYHGVIAMLNELRMSDFDTVVNKLGPRPDSMTFQPWKI